MKKHRPALKAGARPSEQRLGQEPLNRRRAAAESPGGRGPEDQGKVRVGERLLAAGGAPPPQPGPAGGGGER